MRPLPKRKKGERPKVPRPKHSKEAILRALDIVVEKDPELARDFVHRDEDWGSDEDWEGHPDPGDDDEEWEHAEDEDD